VVALTEEDFRKRLRELELEMARTAQRVDDHENDIRVFAPMVTELATARQGLQTMKDDLRQAHDGIRALRELLAREAEERRRGQEERKAELAAAIADRHREIQEATADRHRELQEAEERRLKDRQDARRLMWTVIGGLAGTFVTSAGAVVAAILAGGH
jgi:hypothetical protein